MPPPRKPGKDRQIRRTQNLLREALATLLHQKDYDAIVVKEILERANVGRSTFYTHFKNKDDLLISGIHEMLGAVGPADRPSAPKHTDLLTWFSLPIFEHHDRQRRGSVRIGRKGRAVVHEYLERILADLMSGDARRAVISGRKRSGGVPPELIAQFVASTFILVLNWWMEHGTALSAKEVNEMFRAMVQPAVARALA